MCVRVRACVVCVCQCFFVTFVCVIFSEEAGWGGVGRGLHRSFVVIVLCSNLSVFDDTV